MNAIEQAIEALEAAQEIIDGVPTWHNAGHASNLTKAAITALRGVKEQPVACDDLRTRCAEIIEWQNTGILKGEKLREFASKQRWADDPHVLMIAERETAREAFTVLAAVTPPRAERMSEAWQTISTAPEVKGEAFFCHLAWGPEEDRCTGNGFRWQGRWFAAPVFYVLGGSPRFEHRQIEVMPTHWTKLPEAPIEAETARRLGVAPDGETT